MTAKQKSSSRVRKLDYKSKKKVAKTSSSISPSWRILQTAVKHLWHNKKLFGLVLLMYTALYFLLVRGIAGNFGLQDTREAVETAIGDQVGTFGTGAALFGVLIGSANKVTGEAASVYQAVLLVLMSLSYIWLMRGTYLSNTARKISVSGAFYSSMYPLVQYILVGLVITLQLLPALIGLTLYAIVQQNGIAVGNIENILWVLVTAILICVTIFLLSSSIFALYIVTLPDIRPGTALRKAKAIVKFRRFTVLRKLLFLPLVLALITAAVFIPLALYLTIAAEVLFVVYMLAMIPVTHAYMYVLYRELL